MATFVHVCSETAVRLIRRLGIRPSREGIGPYKERFVYAMPVTTDFHRSHQWVRELRRRHAGRLCGVYFRVPDDEAVLFGHYNHLPQEISAAEALRRLGEGDGTGIQVKFGRRIEPREITRTAPLPQTIGWRYHPGSKGRQPCGCEMCQRGKFGGRKLRAAFEA
jgi:hypothetical protein